MVDPRFWRPRSSRRHSQRKVTAPHQISHRQPQSFLDIGGPGELMRYHVRRAIYKFQIKDEHVQSYSGWPLVAFDESLTQPLGFITLPTTFENKEDPASRKTIRV
jgi:hypothetical protein